LFIIIFSFSCAITFAADTQNSLFRIKYNNPGLVVDAGVGLWAWPIPMDYDNDGDNDLVVVCPDIPYGCTCFFENTTGNVKMPVFEPPVKIGKSHKNVQPSYINGKVRLLAANKELVDYKVNGFSKTAEIYPTKIIHKPNPLLPMVNKYCIRANQWRYVDYDGDNVLDLIVGIGDWQDYGWDNAFDKDGNWTRGPLHGYVYYIHNAGTNEKPKYDKPVKLKAAGKIIDVYGMPTPNFADFDNDGDLDIICGEFVDKFTYFKNTGTRTKPVYAAGVRLENSDKPIAMYLQMITPVAFDWDKDGDVDLICGDEDGRVAFIENTGKFDNKMNPAFLQPKYFQQKADEVKIGALVTPFSTDFDNDGDEDLICGNTAGNIIFLENLDGKAEPKWAKPKLLCASGKPIRIQAGTKGSIQGPCESKWGYTTLSVADWDGDGLKDIIINNIWGKIFWHKNIGSKNTPKLAEARCVKIDVAGLSVKPAWNWWVPKDGELVTQWRTTPFMIDLNKDGLMDLVMLDAEGYLSFYRRINQDGQLILQSPQRLFELKGKLGKSKFRMNSNTAGASGRRKFCIADYDNDGKLDIIINDKNARFYKNISTNNDEYVFEDKGLVSDLILAGHTTSPTTVDWDKDNIPDLLIGAEDGFLYYMKNPNISVQ
jgi:hypothetical protein